MLYEVGFFLIALSVENLLKATWVGKHHTEITGITSIRGDLNGLADHDLARLARNAKVTMSSEEIDLLNALKDCITWAGRYPTPLRVTDYQEAMINGAPTNRFIRGKSIYSIELPMPVEVDAMFEKLIRELQSISEKQTH